jgi:hypothetical protein
MKSPLAIVLLIVALVAPVAGFLWLAAMPGMQHGLAALVAVAAGWALNVAWALAVERAEAAQFAEARQAVQAAASADERGRTLAIAARFGWVCPSVLVLLAWLLAPAGAVATPQAPPSPAAAVPGIQMLTDPGFDALFRQADAACPQKRLRALKPAEMLDAEETFIAGLPAAQRQQVAAAEPVDAGGGYAACVGRNGTSCAATAALRAIGKAGLAPAFVDSLCHWGGPS